MIEYEYKSSQFFVSCFSGKSVLFRMSALSQCITVTIRFKDTVLYLYCRMWKATKRIWTDKNPSWPRATCLNNNCSTSDDNSNNKWKQNRRDLMADTEENKEPAFFFLEKHGVENGNKSEKRKHHLSIPS